MIYRGRLFNNSGVMWGEYDSRYAKYEEKFPFSFPWPQEEKTDVPRYVMGADGYWYDPHAVENGKAVISCAGDLMCEPNQLRAYHYGDVYMLHPQFKYVRNIFKGTDLAVGNLETTLSDHTPYADRLHRLEGGGYHCNAPASYLDAIRYAGFDVLVNANNHNCDSAVMGLMDTLDALDERGFMHTGTFRSESDDRVLYVKVNGIKLAILSYATYFNKIEGNFTQLGQDVLLNVYSAQRAQKDIAAARKKGAEFVLVYIHWGKEYTHKVGEQQLAWAQELADAGADYIVGSHPHALQPYRVVTAQDGRSVPVVFSLGNFVTNELRKISKHTGIVQLALEKKGDKVKLLGNWLIPCYVFTKIGLSKYAAVPTDIALNEETWYETMPASEKYILDTMGDLPKLTTSSITVSELCAVLGVEKPARIKDRPISRLCSKPGHVTEGSAFFGIIWNGSTELADVRKKGAIAIITNRQVEGLPCIVVDDICEAYCRVYAHIRDRFQAKTIAVTGNAGKTTTKEVLDNILRDQFITLSSPGNWNTRHTGMLILQRLRSYHEAYLQEVHEGDPRSAEMISRAIKPNYAIITNVGIAHKENFASEEDFKKAYTEIVAGMPKDGILYVNGDDEALMDSVRKYVGSSCIVKTFGLYAENLDFRVERLLSDGKQITFDVGYAGKTTHITFPSPIKINAYSAVAAFAVGVDMGIPEEQVIASITKYKSDGIRQNVKEYKGLKMLLDCRSATPTSMRSSIESFCAMKPRLGGKRVAVIGEMHIGENSEQEHRKIGEFIAKSKIDYLFCYGEQAKYVYEEAVKNGFRQSRAEYFESKRGMEKVLSNLLRPGDTLLIKGGRRMYLNTSIRKLFCLDYPID